NGDFSYGLQCYGDWVWSKTGQDYVGDFNFYLSTDARSAPWSLEIRCNGPDCLKAAIISGSIPVVPGQTYKLQVFTKCATGGSGFVYVPGMVGGDVAKNVTCDGNWNSSQ